MVLPVSYLQWQQNEKSVLTVFQWISAQNFTREPSPLSREGDMYREGIYYTASGFFFSLSHITRGYLAARCCGQRRELLVGRPLREL